MAKFNKTKTTITFVQTSTHPRDPRAFRRVTSSLTKYQSLSVIKFIEVADMVP